MEGIAECHAVVNVLTTRQGNTGFVDKHPVAVWRELLGVVVGNHEALLGQADELFTIKPLGITEPACAVHDCSILLLTQKNFIGSKVAIRPTSLQLADLQRVKIAFAVYAKDVFSDG